MFALRKFFVCGVVLFLLAGCKENKVVLQENSVPKEKIFAIPQECMRFYSKDSIASHNCCIEHNGCWFVISNNDTVLVPYANPKNKIDIMDVPKHKARIDSLCESIDEKNEYAPLCADIYKHNRN